MKHSSSTAGAPLDRAFLVAVLTLILTGSGVISAYFLSPCLFDGAAMSLSVQRIHPYAACDFLADYAMCAVTLCRSLLIEALIIWLAPYTKLDIPLTSAVFLSRGISLGVAIYICRSTGADASIYILPLFYAVITAVFILFSYSLRRSDTTRPVRETSVHFLIASGFAFAIQILSPLII